MDILYGKNPVVEALRSGRAARKIVIADGTKDEPRLLEILELANRAGIPIEQSTRPRLDDIAHSEHHQGVAGYFHDRAPLTVADLLDSAKPPALFLVLDGIQD